jgi:chemotaxis protein methyltransferase CheR
MDGVLMPARAASDFDVSCDLSESDFRFVADVIRREAGIVVREHKQAMVRGRLVRRARELGLASVTDYCQRIRGPELANELPGLLNALTTNHTAFYREEHHFAHLEREALPRLMDRQGRRERLRVWCAAASSGEEPYTIAATVKAFFATEPHPDCLILATDIDSDVLAAAERGHYAEAGLAKLPAAQRDRLHLSPENGGFRVGPALRAMIRFRQLNILHDWPFRGPFQIIFCRNMLIYFDQPTKSAIISRMVEMLIPGGYLYLGHSEALPGAVKGLQACGRSTYIRS